MDIQKIRVAIVGLGSIGKKHVNAISKVHETELVAIVDKDSNVLNKLEKKVNFYNSINELFRNEKIDGVIIATPNSCHLHNGLEVIKNNCPILIEKPITTSSRDTLKLIEASRKNNVEILVGHHRRHNPIIQKALEIINNNQIGKIRTVHVHCQMFKPNQYFQESEWQKQDGAGPIFVNLIHDLDLMNHLFGDVKSVFAHSQLSIRGYENEDVSSAILEFKNGILCTLLLSDSVASPWSWELTARENVIYPFTNETCYFIGGTFGSLSLPNLKIWNYLDEPHWHKPISTTSIPINFSDPFENQIKHFTKVIKKDELPIVTAEIANKSIKVIEAIKLSSQKKQLVEIKH